MEIFIKIMVWLFMSGIGIGLAAFVGCEGKALSVRHKDRKLLPLIKLFLFLFIIWGVTAIALIFYQSTWYALSIISAIIFLYICASGNPIEEDKELAFKQELQKFEERYEKLVNLYEDLLIIKNSRQDEFMSENFLPTSKEEMAEALRLIYRFQLMEFTPKFTIEELLSRYEELAYFIKDDDAVFMNDFGKMFSPFKKPSDFDKAVELLKSNPDEFERNRQRMMEIHKRVGPEKEMLETIWDEADNYSDEE